MSDPELLDDPPRAGAFQASPETRSREARSREVQPQEQYTEELFMHLERDQLVSETFRPVARAELGPRATAALWMLRIFVVLVSLMVIYAFVQRLS